MSKIKTDFPVGSIWYAPSQFHDGWAMMFRVVGVVKIDLREIEFFVSTGEKFSSTLHYGVEILQSWNCEQVPPEVWYLAVMKGHWDVD